MIICVLLGCIPFAVGGLMNWYMMANPDALPPFFLIAIGMLILWTVIAFFMMGRMQNEKKVILSLNAAALLVLLRFPAIGLYDKLAPETIDLAAQLMCIHLIPAIFLYPLAFQIPSSLRAANDSAYVMWVSILSMVIFRLTLAQVLCVWMGMGAPGVWYAMVVDWICRSTCYVWRWYSGRWKKKCGMMQNSLATK